jgi:hypothetical protein
MLGAPPMDISNRFYLRKLDMSRGPVVGSRQLLRRTTSR